MATIQLVLMVVILCFTVFRIVVMPWLKRRLRRQNQQAIAEYDAAQQENRNG